MAHTLQTSESSATGVAGSASSSLASSAGEAASARGGSASPQVATGPVDFEPGENPARARGHARLVPHRITDRVSSSGSDAAGKATTDLPDLDECPHPMTLRKTWWNAEAGERRRRAVDIDCGRKGCPYCGPRLKRRYVGHYVDHFKAKKHLHFLTLTIDPKCGVPKEDCRKYLIDCWQRFRKRIRRECKKRGQVEAFEYVATIEDHESGWKHLHAMMNASTPASVLREHWFEAGGGVVADVQKVASNDRGKLPRIVGYMVKYGFKDWAKTADDSEKYRKAVLASEGTGYHSKAAKATRKAYAEAKREEREAAGDLTGDDAVFMVEGHWETPSPTETEEVPEYADRITEQDRARFDEYRQREDLKTAYYIQRDDHGPPVLHYRLGGKHYSENLPEQVTNAEISKIYARVRRLRASA